MFNTLLHLRDLLADAFFFGAENLAIDNIDDFQIHPSPQQARSIGNTAALGLGIEHDEELTAEIGGNKL